MEDMYQWLPRPTLNWPIMHIIPPFQGISHDESLFTMKTVKYAN